MPISTGFPLVWGRERVKDTLNALRVYRGEARYSYREFEDVMDEAERHGEADFCGGIRHIEGRHLTAADKRNILGGIEYLRNQDTCEMWLRRGGSKKQYRLTPDPEIPHRYSVEIREVYSTDFGQLRHRDTRRKDNVH